MQNTKNGPDDGEPDYTGPTTRKAIDQEWMDKIERVCQELEDSLVDSETNFGMNESYRLALNDVSHKLVVLHPLTPN